MFKKVTGIDTSCENVMYSTKTSRVAFKDYTTSLIVKKGEARNIKKGYETQKQQIRRDKAEADKFRFTNMKKKADFLPTSLK